MKAPGEYERNSAPVLVAKTTSSKQQEATIKCQDEHSRLIIMQRQDYIGHRHAFKPAAWARRNFAKLHKSVAMSLSIVLCLVLALCSTNLAAPASEMAPQTSDKLALEAELNSLLSQHDSSQDNTNSKVLAEAIISRLMLGNMSDSTSSTSGNVNELMGIISDLDGSSEPTGLVNVLSSEQAPTGLGEEQIGAGTAIAGGAELSGSEALRLRKMLSYLHNYEIAQTSSGLNNGMAFNQFPVLPASQAATIKRASLKMGNYLRQQQHGQQRQANSYGRNTYDFGLGKRPDASVAGNILRFGESSVPVSGQFGKRPSAHRFDFGLGKRVASPAYPRYDFGLGKRAPNRIRYDFGLGRR